MNQISKVIITFVVINFLGFGILYYRTMDSKNVSSKSNEQEFSYSNLSKKDTVNRLSDKLVKNNDVEYGIDVSHWNGNILTDLKNNRKIDFVICKSTQGNTDIDPMFHTNWAFLKENNYKKGSYHFYKYIDDPIEQANFFCDTVGEIGKDDFPLIIDVEELSLPSENIDISRLQKDVLTFLEYVESRTNRLPIIYSDYSFLNKYFLNSKFSKYPIWLAEYSHGPKPNLPYTWKNKGCLIWQKTDNYNIDSRDIDFDIFYYNELK